MGLHGKFLFLDYDGVLHPSEVYRHSKTGRIYFTDEMREAVPNCTLFMHAQLLADILDESGVDLKIILSTSWVHELKSFERAKKQLPLQLQERVAGSTYHSRIDRDMGVYRSLNSGFKALTRFQQIRGNVVHRGIPKNDWIAIDDNADGWDFQNYGQNLIHCHETDALGCPHTQQKLRLLLNAWKKEQVSG